MLMPSPGSGTFHAALLVRWNGGSGCRTRGQRGVRTSQHPPCIPHRYYRCRPRHNEDAPPDPVEPEMENLCQQIKDDDGRHDLAIKPYPDRIHRALDALQSRNRDEEQGISDEDESSE